MARDSSCTGLYAVSRALADVYGSLARDGIEGITAPAMDYQEFDALVRGSLAMLYDLWQLVLELASMR